MTLSHELLNAAAQLPAERLREVNLAIEHGAGGSYRTDFYATYDYKPIWEASRKQGR